MRVFIVLVFAIGLTISATERGLAIELAGKFALVVGNAKYPDGDLPLSAIVNDTRDIADELKRDNFDVESATNLTGDTMRAALDRFYRKIKPGSVALIFFNGFGIQSSRQTYLIPVDAQRGGQSQLVTHSRRTASRHHTRDL